MPQIILPNPAYYCNRNNQNSNTNIVNNRYYTKTLRFVKNQEGFKELLSFYDYELEARKQLIISQLINSQLNEGAILVRYQGLTNHQRLIWPYVAKLLRENGLTEHDIVGTSILIERHPDHITISCPAMSSSAASSS